ncbi:protein of unknown function [Methanoculleus bourgensis]|uniref:Uncharacterized protein n=1 Tax=Methanoculleus bourgensis TaxID=83986 RepID=A0A0X3BJP7_9EURY|nr:protein of unknown function [Methanoculleus bourgensis]
MVSGVNSFLARQSSGGCTRVTKNIMVLTAAQSNIILYNTIAHNEVRSSARPLKWFVNARAAGTLALPQPGRLLFQRREFVDEVVPSSRYARFLRSSPPIDKTATPDMPGDQASDPRLGTAGSIARCDTIAVDLRRHEGRPCAGWK